MTTEEAKKIRIADYLHSLGYSPVKQQGVNLWYKSPFREENEPSFKVNTEREQWFDFGLGKGGNIIALAAHLYATESVPYILKRIEEQTPHVHFAIAFPNISGGYEIRNRYFKGCIAPKEISHIRQSGEPRKACYVFEGFMDYLSFLTLRLESCPQFPDFDRQDYMVLNSVANVSKALYPLGSYERIHCFLDNDRAGMEALQQIRKEYDNTRHIRDASHIYSGCKDLNEYLQKRTETKKQAQSIKVKTPPNKPGGFRL